MAKNKTQKNSEQSQKKTCEQNLKNGIDTNRYKTQSEAAAVAGLKSRQAINDIKKNNRYNFFVELTDSRGVKKIFCDTDNHSWKEYLSERQQRSGSSQRVETIISEKMKPVTVVSIGKNNLQSVESAQSGEVHEKKKLVRSKKVLRLASSQNDDIESLRRESNRQKHSLTGGFDPRTIVTIGTMDMKRLTEIQKFNIEMRKTLNELIEADMVVSIIEAIGNGLEGHFVDLGRKVSGKICTKLDCVGMEKEVENIINPLTAKGIREIKKLMIDSIDIKTYQE